MPLPPGTQLSQYEILSPLGAGSMGEVYRARDTRLDRDVAIKVLPELASRGRDRLVRFETEAKAAAALNHPNILGVFAMGTYAGTPYIVTELLEGMTLTEALRRGPLPLRKAVDIGIQIAHGLAAAHEKGIVHRDLKPDNLFVTKEDRIKILDFGLAKFAAPKETSPSMAPTVTLPGVALGTVGYMSPEQVRGQATDHRTDIFAFGAILYEMVMGRRSFHKPTEADTISAILNEEPPSLAELSPDTPVALARIVGRCLEKNPELRFHSASDLAFALEALADSSSAATAAQRIPQVDSTSRSRTWIAIVSAAAVAILVLLSLFWPVRTPRVANYVQLTHDGQAKSLIGTDGTRLYLSFANGGSANASLRGIAEMSVNGGEAKQIAGLPSSDVVPVDLSPDGSDLLVVDGQGAPPRGPLRSIPILGGLPRRIGEVIAETAVWSPNGKRLAFSNLGSLSVASADGTDPHKLLSVRGDILHLTWSPDNEHIRFDASETAGTVDQQMLWEVSTDGKGLHRLLEGWHDPPNECCGAWTLDGKHFIFESAGQIWALPEKRFLRADPQPIPLTSSPMTLSAPLPSKDGKKLFVLGRTFRGELTHYDPAAHQFVPFLNGISAEYIAFSKDGQWVAYVSYPDGAMWRSRIDGTERMQLTNPPMYPVLPRWSPDGKKIAFFEFGTAADKPARMYTIAPEGGTPTLLLPNDRSQQLDPNWSPNGSKIIFAGESNDPSSSIRIIDLATQKISTLAASDGLYSPRYSPDGRSIAAFSGDSKTLLLFDTQTQKWSQLATGSFGWLTWSHDGQFLYLLDYSGKEAVVRVHVADRKIDVVADVKNFPSTGRYGRALALTPDDSPLILKDTGTQDVYSVDLHE